ncbi:MAG: adenylate/guanylate cyclase domain-containing protein [Haloechinothrix sp.]
MDPDPLEDLQARAERVLLGGDRKYTRHDLAELTGRDPEGLRQLWRALGFATIGDDNRVFTDADLEAIRLTDGLLDAGLITPGTESAVTRAMGHHLARLAEWQILMLRSFFAERPEVALDSRQAERILETTLPALEHLLTYVWRRQLASYAGRALAASEDDFQSRSQVVGFVDMVGYTRMTRRIDEIQLGTVLERFETVATDVIAEHHGRVVKMIGDEVLFVADQPADAAEIALTMNERAEADEDIPELRTGLAWGRVLDRLGDVYGPVVNLAARLTSVARPGTILIDQELAAALEGNAGYEMRTKRPVSVRGYSKLKPIVLRWAN